MFIPLSSLITQAVQRSDVKDQVTTSLALERVQRYLEKNLNPAFHHRVRPAYIKYQTLFLSVSDASLAAHVGFLERGIIDELNMNITSLATRIQVIILHQNEE